MKSIEEARRLFKMAMKDFKALVNMMDDEVFADEIFGFHAQQTAEKSLKAWLSFLGKTYTKTHDLSLLLYLLQTEGIDIEPFNPLIEFNAFAVQFRYEAYDMEDDPLDRQDCIRNLKLLVDYVEKIIECNGRLEPEK